MVTAAPLPQGFDRFVLNPRPSGPPQPLGSRRQAPPVGTTYAFTLSTDPEAAELVAVDLHAARIRVGGGKPFPGPLVVTTEFEVPPPPLTLELTNSRDLCTANTLTELSWTIAGGVPPYTLTIDGETVDAKADSHRVNCGPLTMDPLTEDPLPNQTRTLTAIVTDSQTRPATSASTVNVELAPALPAFVTAGQQVVWHFGITAEWFTEPAPSYRGSYDAVLARWREAGTETWLYEVFEPWRYGPYAYTAAPGIQGLGRGTQHEVAVAALRDPLESHTPQALNWTVSERVTTSTYLANVEVTTTHDTITAQWDSQPSVARWGAVLSTSSGFANGLVENATVAGDDGSAPTRHQVTFRHLPPDTEFELKVIGPVFIAERDDYSLRRTVRTRPAPETGYTPLRRGPQNLRATATATTITVTWDPPHPDANDHYRVHLFYPDRVTPVTKSVYQTPWAVTFGSSEANRSFIDPDTTFRIVVVHWDVIDARAETTVTTRPLIPTSGVRPTKLDKIENL